MTADEKREYMRAWRAANRERLAAYQRTWKAEHPEYFRKRYAADPATHIAYQRRYRERNPEIVSERRRISYWRDPEAERAGARRWRTENLERAKANQAAYYAKHGPELLTKRAEARRVNWELERAQRLARYHSDPARYIEYVKRYQRRKRSASGSHTLAEWQAVLEYHGGLCVVCGTDRDICRDHIVPLTRGGSDDISNIQPLCRSCNARKGNRV